MLLKTIKLPKEKYRNIIFSSDGRLFASNGLNEIIVWDLYGNQQLNQFNANKYYFSHMVFSNHGKYIISRGDKPVKNQAKTEFHPEAIA